MTGASGNPLSRTTISAILVTWNSQDDLETSVTALRNSARAGGLTIEVVVVDNASSDGSADLADDIGADLVIRNPLNAGFATAASQGAARATGSWLLFVNPDLIVTESCLPALWSAAVSAEHRTATLVPVVRYQADPDGEGVYGLGVDLRGLPYERTSMLGDSLRDEPFGGSGGASLIRASALRAIGGFEPLYFAYLEDVDVAWRLRRLGFNALSVPHAVALHRGSSSTIEGSPQKTFLVARNRRLLFARHGPFGWRRSASRNSYDLGHALVQTLLSRNRAPLLGRFHASRHRRYLRFLRLADEVRRLSPSQSISLGKKLHGPALLRNKLRVRLLIRHQGAGARRG